LPSQRPNSLWIGLAAAVTGLGWWGISQRIPQPLVQESATTPSGPPLVVMPFANPDEGPETKIYAQGLTQEVLSQIARFKELSVLGRETSRSTPPDANAVRIHRELGVRYVLEGSVRTAEHQLRVTGRLLDAETGVGCGRTPMTTICGLAASSRSRTMWRRRWPRYSALARVRKEASSEGWRFR